MQNAGLEKKENAVKRACGQRLAEKPEKQPGKITLLDASGTGRKYPAADRTDSVSVMPATHL